MRFPPQPALLQAFSRFARQGLLWLALALAAAHSMAVWHSYSHSIAEASDLRGGKHQAGSHCGLCMAATGIGGAAPPPPVMAQLPRLEQHHPCPAGAVALAVAPQRQPYAIRAPPVLSA
ncbi:MAG: hypothetical protein ABI907_00170 [Ramlibacter sp.]